MPSRIHMPLSICQTSPAYLLAHLLRNLGSSACFHVLPHEAPELGLISLVRGYPGICTSCSLLDRGETKPTHQLVNCYASSGGRRLNAL
jgi:hypothetical protein